MVTLSFILPYTFSENKVYSSRCKHDRFHGYKPYRFRETELHID